MKALISVKQVTYHEVVVDIDKEDYRHLDCDAIDEEFGDYTNWSTIKASCWEDGEIEIVKEQQ
jgi:hypothetical protein